MRPNEISKNPTVTVIGPGAIGGFIAAKLASSGLRTLLVGRDPRWLARARKQGTYVVGGDFGRGRRFGPKQIIPIVRPSGPKCSVIFLCVKSGDMGGAIQRARHWVGPHTAVVSLQNGLTHRRALLSAFGKKRTVFGICYIGTERRGPTNIRHHAGSTIALAIGRNNATAAGQAQALLLQGGFEIKMRSSEDRLLWAKAAFNAAVNPIGALTNRTNGELVDLPPLRELMLGTLKEAVTAARAAGHLIEYKRLESDMLAGLRSTPHQPNSMLQDLRAGRPTEIDAIVKPFLQIAKRKNLKTPLLESLYRFTRRLDRELRAT